MKSVRFLPLLAVTVLGSIAASPLPTADDWTVDRAHTEIAFSVNHFFTPVTGKFESFDISLEYDREDPDASAVDVTIDVASVNTNNEKRDNHLKSEDFFEADSHPQITFRSTSVRKVDETNLIATGPLTIKGITHEVELPISLLGVQEIPAEMREMLGGARSVASFSTSTQVDRRDFGVGVGSWAATLVVGGNVAIDITLEAALK